MRVGVCVWVCVRYSQVTADSCLFASSPSEAKASICPYDVTTYAPYLDPSVSIMLILGNVGRF